MSLAIAPLDDQRARAYLARLGIAPGSATTDLAGLTLLHERHPRTVPFENLSVHLGEPIFLAAAALVDKLTVRRRGWFCYELNGAFAALLTTLGFRVDLYEARVGPDGGGIPRRAPSATSPEAAATTRPRRRRTSRRARSAASPRRPAG